MRFELRLMSAATLLLLLIAASCQQQSIAHPLAPASGAAGTAAR